MASPQHASLGQLYQGVPSEDLGIGGSQPKKFLSLSCSVLSLCFVGLCSKLYRCNDLG